MAELVDALDSGSSGYPWGFESPQLHQVEKEYRPGLTDRAPFLFLEIQLKISLNCLAKNFLNVSIEFHLEGENE